MLILPPGHARTLRQPRAVRAREKWMIGGAAAVLAALAIVIGISLSKATPASGHGCVSVGLSYSTGGEQVYHCGAAARAMCSGVGHAGGTTGVSARAVARECRKAGLPVG
jgi:hypothetical protein